MMPGYPPFDPLTEQRQASDLEGLLTVHNILQSYHGNYDLFTEAIQNAVDAVHQQWRQTQLGYEPEILVEVNARDNTFAVIDNGIGMTPEEARQVFAPNFSLKSRLPVSTGRSLRGHKGVGATFLAYGFNQTDLATRKAGGRMWTGQMLNGRSWAKGEEGADRPLVAGYEEGSEDFLAMPQGTLLRVHCGGDSRPSMLSRLAPNYRAWAAMLRTETAIGMLPIGSEPAFTCKVRFRLISPSGIEEDMIPNEYLFPHAVFAQHQTVDLENYYGENPERGSPPASLRNKEGIYRVWSRDQLEALEPNLFDQTEESLDLNNRDIWAYGFHAYGTKWFDDARSHFGGTANHRRWVRPGLRIASDSMVIGGERQIDLQRYTFSQNTTQVVIHIDRIEPDIGRKGFEDAVEEFAQDVAREIVNYLVDNRDFLRAEADTHTSAAQLEDWVFQMRTHENEHPLANWPGIPLHISSEPEKEQDVIALFNQLLGAQAIRGFDVLSTSSNNQYDSLTWARIPQHEVGDIVFDADARPWGIERFRAEALAATPHRVISVEFKFDLMGLIADFRHHIKNFQDVEIAVAWHAGSGVERASDFELNLIDLPRDLGVRIYPGVTHLLRSAVNADHVIHVMLLSDLLTSMVRGDQRS